MTTHANLFHVADTEFESKVLKADTPVIVDFWAAWCGPCRAIAPVYERLSHEYAGKLAFGKMDVDANPEVPQRFGVQAIPTLVIFNGGREIGRLIGMRPNLKADISRVLEQNKLPTV